MNPRQLLPMLATALTLSLAAPYSAQAEFRGLAVEAKKNPPLVVDRRTSRGLFDGVLKKNARDVFQLPLRPGEAVDITVSSRDLDAKVEVQSEGGEVLAADDDSGGARDANLRFLAPASSGGPLFVIVEAAEGDSGTYSIELRGLKVKPPGQPQALALGSSTAGRIDRESVWRNEDGVGLQTFTFQGKAGDRVRLSASPTDGDKTLELELLAPNGESLSSRSAGNPILVQTLQANGPYEVVVGYKPVRTEGDAKFTLALDALPPAKFTSEAIPVTAGAPVRGTLGPDSPVLPGTSSRPYALYVLSGTAGQRFRASVSLDEAQSQRGKALMARPTLEVGVDTPAGFASVAAVYAQPPSQLTSSRPATFTFVRDGEIQIRLLGGIGTEGSYTLLVTPYSPPVETK